MRELRPCDFPRDLKPVDPDRERDGHAGKQRQRQPLQHAHVAPAGQEHLQHQAQQSDGGRVDGRRAPEDQPQGLGHRGEVGGDVQRVGREQHADRRVPHRPREPLADVGGQAAPGDVTDARADHLDRGHQRQREHDGPQHRVAELRAGLRVGGDATGVVVGRAGDPPGTGLAQAAAHVALDVDPRLAPDHRRISAGISGTQPRAIRHLRPCSAAGCSRGSNRRASRRALIRASARLRQRMSPDPAGATRAAGELGLQHAVEDHPR